MWASGGAKIKSCLKICLLKSNLNLECGAMLDIRKNAKKTSRKIALNKIGSFRMLQVLEMSASVVRSKIPLGVGANVMLMEILLKYSIATL